jgi:hypothetical protein
MAVAFITSPDQLRGLERYQTTIERSYHRAIEALRKAQNDRRRRRQQDQKLETTQQIGFVSQTNAPEATAVQTPPTPAAPEPHTPLTDFEIFQEPLYFAAGQTPAVSRPMAQSTTRASGVY